eukprot:bmy_09437T0
MFHQRCCIVRAQSSVWHGVELSKYLLSKWMDFSFQACIDENLDMVKFLVENGANVNQQDNEGWTPLHAAASCGYLNIAEYFINHGASVGVVNSEGEVPSDLAEEPAMKDLLLQQVKKQGVDLEQSRKAEEQQMLQDARQWLNSGKIQDVRQARSGATALHVAAAKGYSEVLRLLTQAGYELNVQDRDGWTPLHAAAHWGVKEACSILAEALCDMDVRSKLGQTPFDVADEGLVEHLEMLQKKQSVLRSEKETRNKLIESDLNSKLHGRLFKNKEKMLYEEETPKPQETEDENKESSSSSSDEDEGADEASESETEKEADKKLGAIVNHSDSESKSSAAEPTPAPAQSTSSTSSARRFSGLFNKPEEPRDESPSSWRLGLRKTGSQNVLSEAARSREALRDRGASIHRSASSPRISAVLDNREKERENRSYFSSLGPRRLSSASDLEEKENRESAAHLVRSGPPARQLWRDGAEGSESLQTAAPSTYVTTYLKRPPHKSQADSTAERTVDSVSCGTPLCVITNRAPPSTANGVTAAALLSTPGTDSSVEARERRRYFFCYGSRHFFFLFVLRERSLSGTISPFCDGAPEQREASLVLLWVVHDDFWQQRKAVKPDWYSIGNTLEIVALERGGQEPHGVVSVCAVLRNVNFRSQSCGLECFQPGNGLIK